MLTVNNKSINVFSVLLNSFSLKGLRLSSRVVMAPMTRCAATADHVPTEHMAAYYRDRASAGLLIAEATSIAPCANAYPNTPGLFSQAQINGWKSVTDAVHETGGKIFVQLWHAGMMGHSQFRGGDLPLSPSGIRPLREKVPRSDLTYEQPRIMEADDFEFVIKCFKEAACNAKIAGFDGVELHGAGGYLLDSFLHHHTNRRLDHYGVDKTRFVLEVFDAVCSLLPTGIRLSPAPLAGMENMHYDARDLEIFKALFKELERREAAYIHVAADNDTHPEIGRVSQFVRENYQGILIGSGGYTVKSAKKALSDNAFDLISFGRLMLANPNLTGLITKNIDPQPFDYRMVANPPVLPATPDG